MDNNVKQFIEKVEVVNVQLLDFATDGGDSVKGLKINYFVKPDERVKENYIGGKLESSFLNIDDYKKKFDILKTHYNSCKDKHQSCYVNLVFVLENINKKPKIQDITL